MNSAPHLDGNLQPRDQHRQQRSCRCGKSTALIGIDILTDEELRKEMKADFDKRTEGFVYKSPINEMIKEPVGLPDEMRHFGPLLELKESIIKTAEDDQLKPGLNE